LVRKKSIYRDADKGSDKLILILGASGDLGSTIARELQTLQQKFILQGNKNAERLRLLTKELDCKAVTFDITKESEAKTTLEDLFLKNEICTVINCIGINVFKSFEGTTAQEWNALFSVNVRGTIFISEVVLTHLEKQKRGALISICSVRGLSAPISHNPAYCISKKAQWEYLRTLTKKELSTNIITIFPGIFASKLLDEARLLPSIQIPEGIERSKYGTSESIAHEIKMLLQNTSASSFGLILDKDRKEFVY
jgi:NADP-dependent 3-hydroxy acid dehydrogenase YdfG